MPFVLAQTETPDVEGTLDELSQLTTTDWLVAGSIVVAAVIIGLLLRAATTRALRSKGQLLSRLIGRFVLGLAVAVGLVYALNQVGVAIGPLLGLLGLLGLALALALQEVLSNFIAGVMLSLQRPFRVGDEIKTAGHEGRVEDVSLRTTTLRTFDGVQVHVPNAMVWEQPIENFTTLGLRRSTLPVGVGYDTDLDATKALLVETVEGVNGVEADPAPQAFVHEFADSSINYAVHFWHQPQAASEWSVRDEVARKIKKALDDAGVEIPFPQLVLHVEEVPDELGNDG